MEVLIVAVGPNHAEATGISVDTSSIAIASPVFPKETVFVWDPENSPVPNLACSNRESYENRESLRKT